MLLEESGRMDPARVADIVRQVASALDAAHAEGLVHRDVKPGNILLAKNRDRVYLADFGLTKRTASDDSLTGAGEFLGTFSYAAPEQLGNDPVDGQADQYAPAAFCTSASPATRPSPATSRPSSPPT